METIWQDLTSVKKGNVGEKIVNDFLISKGFIPYSPDANGAHPFDRLVASRDKRTLFIVDAKSKPARIYYPDTGIDVRHYKEYKYIQKKYNIDVFVFFVDENKREVYGNFLKRLDEAVTVDHNGKSIKYPMEYKGIIYFPLVKMMHVAKIEDHEVSQLKEFSTMNKAYLKA